MMKGVVCQAEEESEEVALASEGGVNTVPVMNGYKTGDVRTRETRRDGEIDNNRWRWGSGGSGGGGVTGTGCYTS
jgi:hypothetical protein